MIAYSSSRDSVPVRIGAYAHVSIQYQGHSLYFGPAAVSG